ncbi:DNA (cytosine-5-)-methyltransferase [Alloscardovia macacae]|uniref:Cytosine-specific methyltransferase n=1 Tax=Alloscardovia macacae TaxID=1160091 RepID=A0A261F473_9BIFI|nr:DNA (cytosine-5-)-methyltransferase [Alloscardovia macacae]OZG53891.1 DNA (cytosine-5-)-methyltransferase [Alloscardovia macacae]
MSTSQIRIAELFAGVGGFRLGLDGYHNDAFPEFEMPAAGPFTTIWANNWEPPGTASRQFAARCYETRFGEGSIVNEDIHKVMDEFEAGERTIPDVDMVVGGFPCQDYSVAKPLSKAGGIEGKKGVLWWDIYRFLQHKSPRFVLLENVDRLLKSPAAQRGRDFAIILSCFASLGYAVEWRVVNSAEYGCSQRRKRVYIFAEKTSDTWNLRERMTSGVMYEAFPIHTPENLTEFSVPTDPYEATQDFGKGMKKSPFEVAGVMQNFSVVTCAIAENYEGERRTLGDVLIPEDEVPEEFYIDAADLPKWEYLKGSKSEERVNKATGFTYHYSEGKMAFPDSLEKPSRTILTGEGGRGASRFKHVIKVGDRYRRLVPDELDQLQGFPRGWTNTGMTDGHRAFCMGNALVTTVPHRIGIAMVKLYGI